MQTQGVEDKDSKESINNIWKELYNIIHEDTYNYKIVKPIPSKWVEETIFLANDGVSRFTGYYNYDISPYVRELIDFLHPADPTRTIAIMKCAQSGFTQGLIIPGIAYIISENPDNMLFMAGDKELARNSIRTRFDPVMQSSGLTHLIRPNVVRKRNQRTGDTDFSKEYAGGSLIVEGTQNCDKMRQFSVKTVFADDWEAAPRADKKEGTIRTLIEGRQTSFGNLAKTAYVSTPLIKQTSNIEPVYLLGDQRKWNWECPHCLTYIPIEWKTSMLDDDTGKEYGGIKWEINKNNRLIKESVHYQCQSCGGKINYSEKYDLNLKGKWIPTVEPEIEFYKSYQLNALVIPPGFTTWIDLVVQFLQACPPGRKIDNDLLKAFLNIRLGQTWEELGTTPKVHQLLKNKSPYSPGIVPDLTCEGEGNKKIIMLTFACDLNGIMKPDEGIEDVRVDWEVVAHTVTGATYSVDQGSIGTFKRSRERSKIEIRLSADRKKWTYMHGVENSVWPEVERLMEKNWECESGRTMKTLINIVDTGFFTRLARDFVDQFEYGDNIVIGVKGSSTEIDFRKTNRDTSRVRKSREENNIYIVEVDQIKDELAAYMKLRKASDGYQPAGFMNFPEPKEGKYSPRGFFSHFEGERRIEKMQDGKVVGFKWDKKHSHSQNHFWDVRIYGYAAKDIYLDLLRRSDPKLRDLNWNDFVNMML